MVTFNPWTWKYCGNITYFRYTQYRYGTAQNYYFQYQIKVADRPILIGSRCYLKYKTICILHNTKLVRHSYILSIGMKHKRQQSYQFTSIQYSLWSYCFIKRLQTQYHVSMRICTEIYDSLFRIYFSIPLIFRIYLL